MFAAAILVLHTLTAPALSYARDGQTEYLGTRDGLWRLAPLQRIAFPGQIINALAVHDGKLYVGKQPTIEGTSSEHTLVVSSDHGATFTSIDQDLRDCTLGCAYMAVYQIAVDGGRIFVNAGGNVMVSTDLGATWTRIFPVSGGPTAQQLCPLQFLPMGATTLLGGECPLDIAWLGRLGPDGHLERIDVEGLENRNVQFIRAAGSAIFVSVEGGILRSDDGGATFRWALRYSLASMRYPYMGQMTEANGTLVFGGFDKGLLQSYLISSTDGRTWRDLDPPGDSVTLLAIRPDGRILIGYTDGERPLLGELTLPAGTPRRRSVRR